MGGQTDGRRRHIVDLGAFTSGLLTGLREGVEAALIVSIVLTYLVRTGRTDQTARVWLGTGLAALLSLAVGIVIFVTIGSLEEPYEQIFEGTTLLVAAAVVTWMLFWMRRQARSVKGELQAAVDRAVAIGGAWGLAGLALPGGVRGGGGAPTFPLGPGAAGRGGAGRVLLGAGGGVAVPRPF